MDSNRTRRPDGDREKCPVKRPRRRLDQHPRVLKDARAPDRHRGTQKPRRDFCHHRRDRRLSFPWLRSRRREHIVESRRRPVRLRAVGFRGNPQVSELCSPSVCAQAELLPCQEGEERAFAPSPPLQSTRAHTQDKRSDDRAPCGVMLIYCRRKSCNHEGVQLVFD